MHRFATVTTLTVLSLLIFANSLIAFGQSDSIYRLPAGTRISLKMDAEINSKVSSVNDTFIAMVAKPVTVRDTVVLPVGTVIEGRVSGVTRAAALGRSGRMEVVFETLKISNVSRHIDGAMITQISARSSPAFSLLSILGGLGGGAAIGAASRSSNGTLIGAGVGGGIGTLVALLRKGKEVRIRRDEEFEIELKKEVVLPVVDY